MVASSAGSAAFQSAAVLDRAVQSALADRRLTRGIAASSAYQVWGVGCGVWGVGCGVWGVGCGVWV